MNVQRTRPKGVRSTSFGLTFLASCVLAILPTAIGYQDFAGLIARQPAVAERWHKHIIASPFGTIHAATFSFPSPLGTAIPAHGASLASLNPGATPSEQRLLPPLEFPIVDRSRKGDSLRGRPAQPLPEALVKPEPEPREPLRVAPTPASDGDIAVVPTVPNVTQKLETEVSVDSVELPYRDLPPADLGAALRKSIDGALDGSRDGDPARLYFGIDPMSALQTLVPWAPGEEPVLTAAGDDLEIKYSAAAASIIGADVKPAIAGETVAAKGQVAIPVTGQTVAHAVAEVKRSKSPAERLGLEGKARAKAEKCLANAVYFEARGEVVRGQMAVAQVVMNRVFSRFYPNDVCAAVYQNAHRHLSCQFTFACDGIPDIVTEPEAWEIAKRIAKDTLDGKLWVAEVARSTHYHASWVRPSWINEMRTILRLGVHTFYRPRLWGDGRELPGWGDAAATRLQAEAMESGRKG